ncbi:hypothetical protein BKA64DRAFT_652000 [Cadophora sp. MPI-SDFR-AT-0126]|nr:hypothetical protein BKA64DRAFT_652000 [Leotiomycetes sp. MPI-SDFR-AT-0126]
MKQLRCALTGVIHSLASSMCSSWIRDRIPGYIKSQAYLDEDSQEEQLKAEEIVSDVFGDTYMRALIIQTTLQIRSPRMDPLEWVLVKNILDLDQESATTSYDGAGSFSCALVRRDW